VSSRKALQHHDCLVDMFTLLAQIGEHFKNVHVRRVIERRSVDSRRKPLHERKARLLTAWIALGSALLLQNLANLVVAGVDPATIGRLSGSRYAKRAVSCSDLTTLIWSGFKNPAVADCDDVSPSDRAASLGSLTVEGNGGSSRPLVSELHAALYVSVFALNRKCSPEGDSVGGDGAGFFGMRFLCASLL